jgi:thiol-disulfide isomerase/thioredoxin
LLIACLCAGWCTACRAYEGVFAALALQHPAHRFVWIDIEDHADALGDAALDIENFPTLLIQHQTGAGDALFYGTVLPHASTLTRMLEAAAHEALASGQPCPDTLARAVAGLAARLPEAS